MYINIDKMSTDEKPESFYSKVEILTTLVYECFEENYRIIKDNILPTLKYNRIQLKKQNARTVLWQYRGMANVPNQE